MKTTKKLEKHFQRIFSIRYDNPHGGAYAYVQFLAYSRDLLAVMGSFKGMERQAELIEGISWLFNEALISSFTPKNRIIFEEKMFVMKDLFEQVRVSAIMQVERPRTWKILHAEAA